MRDRDQAAALLDAWLRSWTDLGFGYATVFADDALVGFCGVKPQRVVGREVMNLYYRFAPSAWGHGYAAEAAAAIADWSAAAHPSAPVLARMARNNPASQRVAERIGLTRLDLIDPEDEIPHWIYCSVAEGLRPAAL